MSLQLKTMGYVTTSELLLGMATLADLEIELRIAAAVVGIVLGIYTMFKIRLENRAKKLDIELKELELEMKRQQLDDEQEETKKTV